MFFSNLYLLNFYAQLCPTLCDTWVVACQGPVSMEFSRQQYWNGLPFLATGIFPTQGSSLSLFGLLHWQAVNLLVHHLGNSLLIIKSVGLFFSDYLYCNDNNCSKIFLNTHSHFLCYFQQYDCCAGEYILEDFDIQWQTSLEATNWCVQNLV